MKIYGQPVELIVDVPSVAAQKSKAVGLEKSITDTGLPITDMESRSSRVKLPRPKASAAMAKAMKPAPDKLYVKTGVTDAEMNPWDAAHTAAKQLGASAGFIEPDLLQQFSVDANRDTSFKKGKAATPSKPDRGFDPDWYPHKNIVWHLGDDFSELKSARDAVANLKDLIRIGHIDTGYSQTHPIIREDIKANKLQRSFVEGEDPKDAHDRLLKGTLRMPGHGTGTLGILAGAKVKLQTDDGGFNDVLGAAPFADIVCCRIASSVVLFKTSTFADALFYLTELSKGGNPVHVISMSMGGAPARNWVEAVNNAYMSGITMVTAAGNNFNGLPTTNLVYPARFARVIAACGATYDNMPYSNSKIGEMAGCFGPDRFMGAALAAYTPNVPWASAEMGDINFAGAGTSSATPQIAAAAAIYYRKWFKELSALQPWQRVEAIRAALFQSAKKKVGDGTSFKRCFGNGILRANRALAIAPDVSKLKQSEEATMPFFPILTTLFKAKPGKREEMFQTELAQLTYQYKELRELIDDEGKDPSKISNKKWGQFREAVLAHPAASNTLKQALSQ